MTLSNRLMTCASFVRPGGIVADIGTDHGYLPIYLIQSGIAESAIAADIGASPLAIARKNTAAAGLDDKISFRLSDGLTAFTPGDADTVICAGMGGETIISILETGPGFRRSDVQFILQPQSKAPLLRQYLKEHGFRVLEERFAEDGDFVYTVLDVRYTGETVADDTLNYFLPMGETTPSLCRTEYLTRVADGLRQTVKGLASAQKKNWPTLRRYQKDLKEVLTMLGDSNEKNITTVRDVLDFMSELAPMERAESWDNVGHLVGRADQPVTKIVTALDITMSVIREAIDLGAELIVSHHPVIWDTYKFVNDSVLQQDRVLTLAENHIAAICMHTNLDMAEGGVDDTLVETLGLKAEAHLGSDGYGHVCNLPEEMELSEFLGLVKDKLHANGLHYADAHRPVRRIATGCGSGADYLADASKAGCDTFVTGDVKYNYFQDALDLGINLIDAGHYPTENPIVEKISGKLQARFPEIEIIQAESIAQPDHFYI